MTAAGQHTGDGDQLDAIDRALLRELIGEPRLSVVELAKRLGVVRATVQSRLDRLTRRGVVSGGGIALDVARIGYPLTAFVGLQIRQGHGAEVRARLQKFAEVLEIHTTAGSFDLLCRVAAKSSADMQRTIDRIVDHPTIVRSTTSVVLSTPMSYRVLPLIAGTVEA
ncbi:MAG: AsnC family transcriptional regulator [Actinobacteria bacterium 69-20]|jgi:DNA-binding Lrp family transcriptional regulator|nr:Lrp/AsnC family transcriptional regulator [Actinomycetota bacterium]OJV23574.1 MAG: AsnC family transcriptional regulator [Actinobacteria bacterium 69-20]